MSVRFKFTEVCLDTATYFKSHAKSEGGYKMKTNGRKRKKTRDEGENEKRGVDGLGKACLRSHVSHQGNAG